MSWQAIVFPMKKKSEPKTIVFAEQVSPHTTTVLRNSTGRLDLARKNGEHDTYSVSCSYSGAPGLVALQTSEHAFAIHRPPLLPAAASETAAAAAAAAGTVTVEVVCRYQLGCCVGTVWIRCFNPLLTTQIGHFTETGSGQT